MKYKIIPGIGVIISLALWLGQQWITDDINSTYADFPWVWIFALFVTFILGVVYSDLLSDGSRLQLWWRERRRIFRVTHFSPASTVKDHNSFIKPTCGISFTKRIKNVQITVQITQSVNIEHAKESFVLLQETVGMVEPNLRKEFVFATYPKSNIGTASVGYPYWGEDENKQWAGDGNHVITLRAKSLFRFQEEHFLIAKIRNPGGGPEPVLLFGDEGSKRYMEIHGQ